MVGQNVNGKCSECGQWYWEKALDQNGRFIPTGVNAYGKKTYLNKGVHNCPGPNYMASAGQKVDKLHQRTNEAVEFVKDRAQSNHLNIHGMAADLALVKEDVQTCKQHLETLVKKAGLFEGADTMIKQSKRNPDPANMGPPPKRPDIQMPMVDVNEADFDDEDESQVNEAVEEIAETDDVTHGTDTGSINVIQ